MGHMRNHANTNTTTTITVTQKFANGDTEVVFERSYPTPAKARRAMISAVDRITGEWGREDPGSWRYVATKASEWDGRTAFSRPVGSWNNAGSLLFEAV